MHITPKIFTIIPAYNEGTVIRRTVEGLVPQGFEIVVVDDGSTVPQREYLLGLPVRYLRHGTNLGQGAALQTGTEYALQAGADVIVHFDADGQHDATLVKTLTAPILSGECDVVLASRFLDPLHRKAVPLQKQLLLKGGVCISWMFSGLWLTDTHNGFRALSRGAAEQIRMQENGFAHATEILELIRTSGLRYREMPALTKYTEYAKKKGQRPLNSINIVLDLLMRKLVR